MRLRSVVPLLLVAGVALPIAAAVPSEGPADELSLRFVPLDRVIAGPGGEALLDLGAVAADPRARRGEGIVIHRRVALRLESRSGAIGTARVAVALASEMPGCRVSVDGIAVTTLPRTIDPVHRVGTTVVHHLELRIDDGAPAGGFLLDLEWLVASD